MNARTDMAAAPRRRSRTGDVASYVLIAGAVVLAWQIALQPFLQRAPVEAAVRLAPSSPLVLSRAAEVELAAGRNDNAAALGREALARAPFDVRALRTVGLTEARAGRVDRADDVLTLAGNWSLRDDPTHAWLIERRLRRGDYSSAFAHADTLVRRRQDIQPQVFSMFTVAGAEDPQRALPVIAALLAANPPWRQSYLFSLEKGPEEFQIAANLATLLQASAAPLSNPELQRLYRTLLRNGQIDAIRTLRSRLNRPLADIAVTNGDFADSSAPGPFQWRLTQKAGIVAEIVADDFRSDNSALRVDYDGYGTGRIVEQLMVLAPGSYEFSARTKVETGDPSDRLAWKVTCVTRARVVASIPGGSTSSSADDWTPFSGRFRVPGDCQAQWLTLEARPGDRRSPTIAWFDQIAISSPAG